ncbi:MAG: hypothetical protein V4526_03075 [Patescibacteria group bacterium]
MSPHKGKRLFITGIPTSGKSYLAKKLAAEVGGDAILLDDYREVISSDERYGKWVTLFWDQDEKTYLTTTSPEKDWANIVAQSEGIWPAFLEKIDSYKDETKPIIFECVNILPHLAKRDLYFPGIALIGSSYEDTLARNKKEPRWGKTEELQVLEAKLFFEMERPYYKAEAEKYGYPVFEKADDAFEDALKLLQ